MGNWRFKRDDSYRVETAEPTSIEKLRAAIYAASERCRAARARGWIDEHTERLPDDTREPQRQDEEEA